MAQIYHVLIVLLSVLGLLFDGYFYCFHLFHIVVNNDILLRVIQVELRLDKYYANCP